MRNKKYHVVGFSINHTSSNQANQFSQHNISGMAVSAPRSTEIEISLSIIVPDSNNLKLGDGDTMEAFESFLSSVPDWCSPKMMHTALQAKYPERYL